MNAHWSRSDCKSSLRGLNPQLNVSWQFVVLVLSSFCSSPQIAFSQPAHSSPLQHNGPQHEHPEGLHGSPHTAGRRSQLSAHDHHHRTPHHTNAAQHNSLACACLPLQKAFTSAVPCISRSVRAAASTKQAAGEEEGVHRQPAHTRKKLPTGADLAIVLLPCLCCPVFGCAETSRRDILQLGAAVLSTTLLPSAAQAAKGESCHLQWFRCARSCASQLACAATSMHTECRSVCSLQLLQACATCINLFADVSVCRSDCASTLPMPQPPVASTLCRT